MSKSSQKITEKQYYSHLSTTSQIKPSSQTSLSKIENCESENLHFLRSTMKKLNQTTQTLGFPQMKQPIERPESMSSPTDSSRITHQDGCTNNFLFKKNQEEFQNSDLISQDKILLSCEDNNWSHDSNFFHSYIESEDDKDLSGVKIKYQDTFHLQPEGPSNISYITSLSSLQESFISFSPSLPSKVSTLQAEAKGISQNFLSFSFTDHDNKGIDGEKRKFKLGDQMKKMECPSIKNKFSGC